MSKRKLSKQQSERIKKNQQEIIDFADDNKNERHGIIISHHGSFVDVEYEESGLRKTVSCHLRANLENVVSGDRVIWLEEGEKGVVVSFEARENVLQRPDSFGHLRPVAANISQIVIVFAPEPEAHHGLIDRYLVAAENLNVDIVLLLNKSDLIKNQAFEELSNLIQAYKHIGYRVLEVSAHTGTGLNILEDYLNDQTSIFVGQSGVGKSSVIKKLLPHENVRIGELSEVMAKGKHTTTHSQLYHFSSGGVCIDSPGIREFGLWHFDADDVLHGFIDIREHALNCKFRNCQHDSEPNCGVKEALNTGLLYKWRMDSYKRIINTLNEVDIKKGKSR